MCHLQVQPAMDEFDARRADDVDSRAELSCEERLDGPEVCSGTREVREHDLSCGQASVREREFRRSATPTWTCTGLAATWLTKR